MERLAKKDRESGAESRPVTDEPIPEIESLAPLRVVQGTSDAVITIKGKNFLPDSFVQIGDVKLQPRRTAADTFTVTVPAAVTRNVGTYQVAVVTPLPGGGQSHSRYLFVDYAASPQTSAVNRQD